MTISLVGVFAAIGDATTLGAAYANTLVVDNDGQATASNCAASNAAFNKIQAAVNSAASGDTIFICPGTYNEQVVVTKSNLAVRGSGAGATVLRPTVVAQNTSSVITGTPTAPILLVQNATEVTIGSLTIDGSAADSGAVLSADCRILPFYTAIYYRNSSGTIDTARMTGIKSSTACADAIRAEIANLVVTRTLVDDYGRVGISCAAQNTKCTVTGNTVKGLGPVNNQGQAGIMIRATATGVISGNIVMDHFLIGAHGVGQSSVGIVLFNAQPTTNPHLIRENVFINNQVNVQRQASAASF